MSFEWPVRVYWEDTDAGGIVFYANYLKFFERARTEWLRSLGVEQHALRTQTGGMFVVSETQVKYHRPALLDDVLRVTAHLTQSGKASLTIAQARECALADIDRLVDRVGLEKFETVIDRAHASAQTQEA